MLHGAFVVRPETFSASIRICSGVEPQHPPMSPAPASIKAGPQEANSSGVIGYTVTPSSNTGSPAFGFARIGTSAYSFIFLMTGIISPGPVEQFTPIISAPMLCNTTTAVTGSVPYKVLPSSWKVREAITAALVSARLIIVSTTNRSTPASNKYFACSL